MLLSFTLTDRRAGILVTAVAQVWRITWSQVSRGNAVCEVGLRPCHPDIRGLHNSVAYLDLGFGHLCLLVIVRLQSTRKIKKFNKNEEV